MMMMMTMMSFSMEYSGQMVIRLFYKFPLLLLSLLLRCLLLLLPNFHYCSNEYDVGVPADSHPHHQASPGPLVSAQAVRDTLHVATYGEISGDGCEGQQHTCAVCLNELRRRDSVWVLRNCCHVFHKRCLDRWLDHDEHLTCPLCRAPLLLTTPPLGLGTSTSSEPSWAVERLLYLFGDDLLFSPS